MVNFFKALTYIVLILVMGVLFTLWSYRVPITCHLLTKAIANPFICEDVDISISLKRITAKNAAILNPKDKKRTSAIDTKRLEVKVNLSSIFTDTVIIEEIVMDNVDFFMDMYNVTGTESNWKDITRNIQNKRLKNQRLGKHVKMVLIKTITLNDLHFSYRNPALTGSRIRTLKTINQFKVQNVGKGHRLTAGDFVEIISKVLTKEFTTITGFTDVLRSIPSLPFNLVKNMFVIDNGEKTGLDEFLSIPGQLVRRIGGFFKNFFKGHKKEKKCTKPQKA